MEMEQRLERIESKLDKLSDAIVAIARTEEQIATIFNTQKAMEAKLDLHADELRVLRERTHDIMNNSIIMAAKVDKIDKLEERVDDLRLDTHDNTKMTKRISWGAGIIFTALVAIIFTEY